MILVGILTNREGQLEVILQREEPEEQTGSIPIQRKRYKEGEEVEPGIFLATISHSQKLVVLQKDQDVQLLFLRDPNKRPVPQPVPLPALDLTPDEIVPAQEPTVDQDQEPAEEQSLLNMIRQQMPPQIQAIDRLSQMFFATPLF